MANRWNVTMRLMRAAAMSCTFAATLAACQKSTLSSGPYEGLVRDKATGQPISGALVYVKWMGANPSSHSSYDLCYHHEIVETGPDGRFRVPAWRVSTKVNGDPTWLPYINPLHVEDFVFKAGYRDNFVRGGPRDPSKIELEPIVGTASEQIRILHELSHRSGCDGDSAKKELPWLSALVLAGKTIASDRSKELSVGDRKMIDSLIFGVDLVQYGQDEAYKRLGERERAAKGR